MGYFDPALPCLTGMLDTKSPSRAWIDLTDVFAPKKVIKKRRIEQKFDSISMAEGEDPVEYLSRIDQAVLKLAMLAGTNGKDDVNVHIVPKPVGVSSGEEKFLLSIPDLTRSKIEEIVRNAYMSHKQNVGKAKSQTKVIPHVIYASGAQPAGAGRNGMGRNAKGKLRQTNSRSGSRNSSSSGRRGNTRVGVAV